MRQASKPIPESAEKMQRIWNKIPDKILGRRSSRQSEKAALCPRLAFIGS
jgi:hypothetical protein